MRHTTHSVSPAPIPDHPAWWRVSAASLAGALTVASAVVGIAAPAQATTSAQDVIDDLTSISTASSTGAPVPVTLYAGWHNSQHAVRLDSQGGTPMGVAIVDLGDTLDSPEVPERTGFEFAGWFEDADGTELFDFATAITYDLTLYAAWTELLAPVIVSGPWPQAVVGQSYEFTLAATGYPAPTFDVQGLPEGLVFD